MALFEFFYPEQAQAGYMREMASSMRTSTRRAGHSRKRVSDVEKSVPYHTDAFLDTARERPRGQEQPAEENR